MTTPLTSRRMPNVLYVVWDDASIAAWDAFGGLIETPNMKRLAARGLRYSQWHTPARSALTRSCLLTGRDCQPGKMARAARGGGKWREQSVVIPPGAGTLAEILAENGYRTYCVGKWHLSHSEASSMLDSRRTWPLGRGFDRYYGFLGGQTSPWYPDLVYDNQYVDPPYPPAEGYHLSRDLADMAVEFIREGAQTAPGQAWLCYLSFGANDAPRDWTDKYRDRFEMGYDRYREIVLGRMKRLGMVPDNTGLAPGEQRLISDALADADVLPPWRSLTEEQRQLSNRGAESYAGLCSFTDYQVGRVLDYLEESGQLDDTIVLVCSANATPAASHEYPAGWAWAFRTPYNLLRQHAHGGSVPSPLIISWPREMKHVAGGVRDQYHHAADLVPTILGCAAIDSPRLVRGHLQAPMDGMSMRYTFATADAPSARRIQCYEVPSGRALYFDGWKAIEEDSAAAARRAGAAAAWQLYHVAADRAEIYDVAARYPAKTVELASLWEAAAGRAMLFRSGTTSGASRAGSRR
jgi:arylsulfatase